jgi:L-threonylcarbamoyladenylate synthase
MDSHYSPRKPLYVVDRAEQIPQEKQVGWLRFVNENSPKGLALSFPGTCQTISETGDLREAASRFFQTLRFLDDHPEVAVIYAQPFPDIGLGRALNDRLNRASHR